MHSVPRARPASRRAHSHPAAATALVLLVAVAAAACGSGGGAGAGPLDIVNPSKLDISPASPTVVVGGAVRLHAVGGVDTTRWTSLDEAIARVGAGGELVGIAPGRTSVVAWADGISDTVAVLVTESARPISAPQWTIADDGNFVEVENGVLRLRFGYAAAGRDGWFTGGESSGGGGRDGGIVELYYKPTSSTRNLVFRNGQWGSLYDQMDLFEAEGVSADRTDHDAPDHGSGRDAELISHRVYESAGRAVAEFEFVFRAWRIRRTYVVYPWGDITVHAHVTQTETGRFNYLSHRFIFAASRASIDNATTGRTYDWGTNYQADREMMHAWSDEAPIHEYVEPIRDAVDRNTVLYDAGRRDAYSGFMLDDRNGNDPDIVVMNGDRRISESPFQTVSARFGGKQYVESALFSPRWAPGNQTHADMTWFYLGTPCCEVRWSDPPTWTPTLGSWEETFHVLLRQGLEPDDYLPLWRSRAGELASEGPREVRNASVRLDSRDRLYHLDAGDGETVEWEWQRAAGAEGSIDYRTAFVVHGFAATSARIEGESAPELRVYRDDRSGELLVVLVGEQPAEPSPYRIVLSR